MSRPRVALTTTARRGTELAEIVIEQGLQPVPLPCIEVVPAATAILEKARSFARGADWLVATSPRVITVLWPEGRMPHVAVAAVGDATAAAVEHAGGSVAVTGEAGADSLLDRLPDSLAGKTVLWAHAAASDPSTLWRLNDSGAKVTDLAVYDTRSIPPAADPVDVALFGSPSAVTGWAMSRAFDELVLAAIGETTAAALSAHGHRPQLVATRPDFPTLIQDVASYLNDRSPV